ncbi:hypothetical protein [Saccharopolyspora phatthalungensis]|uniref:Uncharacterized protein n=1 Tax=Saccharopolyspora phatthalungensis TaxID=664693 RepID=A0A840QBB6_9PSEU|nr:hypothetical protein [Saccharopolyspora phatthalungensis]MBB5155938.1 hypothetical protein [Saccharopolyspora phatthalungensis]
MTKHRRTTPLLRLMARLKWQREPNLWTVRCRDSRGRRARLHLHLTTAGLTITPSAPGPWTLTPLDAGRLRAAVRDVLLSLDRLSGGEHEHVMARTQSANSTTPTNAPRVRDKVRLDPPARPTVSEIASRLASPATHTLEANDDHHDNPARHVNGTAVAA